MEIELFNNKLKVFECGKVLVLGKIKPYKDEYYEKKFHLCGKSYKVLQLRFEGKMKNYKIHRLVAFAYLGLDIENPKQVIDHINRDTFDNRVSNLRIVSHQQNMFNRNAKGYSKNGNKYQVKIRINGKDIYLGTYDTRELAYNAYLIGKQIHHLLPQ